VTDLTSIQAVLAEKFGDQRVVFWHDPSSEYADDLETLTLDDVNIVRVEGNEFGVKNLLLADHKTNHLVYRAGEVLPGTQNWLLDLELAYGVFTADKVSMLMQEFGLDNPAHADVIADHLKFFAANSRKQALKKHLKKGDDPSQMRAKMSQVLVKASGHWLTDIVREILTENAYGKDAKLKELTTYGLDEFFWGGLKTIYQYPSENPSVDDFVLWMYYRAFDKFASEVPDQYKNIRNDFNSLRYDVRTQGVITKLASRAADALDIAEKIENRDIDSIADITIFEEVDCKVIHELATVVANGTITPRDTEATIKKRSHSMWQAKYAQQYDAILSASKLLTAIAALPTSIASMEAGLETYQSDWHRIDKHYRHFTYAYQTAEFKKSLEALKAEVDKQYSNTYLYNFGSLWQHTLEDLTQWKSTALDPQTKFYTRNVKPLLKDGRSKAVVIVSDGMRYEVGYELASLIRNEDRLDAALTAVLGSLPSYTQLGMASLLPHKKLEPDPTGMPVFADGKPTNGTANRDKILQSVNGHAMTAADVTAMSRDELRDLYKQHQVIYVYHDRIDALGDNAKTESSVFQAVAETLQELLALVKKFTGAIATNIVITADHGFLYQDIPLEESYYVSQSPQGEAVTKANRRFVLGRSLQPSSSFMTFTAEQVGLSGDLDIQIPKSIHRIKQPGSGTRYVHGGASLQEIVVPVITVNKKRVSDVRSVNVDIKPDTDKITTGQLSVNLLQSEPVTDKIQAREVRLGLYVKGTLISSQPVITFDSTSEDQRDRYQKVALYLTKDADEFNHQPVELRVESPIPNTSQWKIFARANYTLKRSFTTDF
jgi:uncharacterized protein (TIGR02687 family)